jgi:hypothetical protein
VIVLEIVVLWLIACSVMTLATCAWCRAGHAEDVAYGYDA